MKSQLITTSTGIAIGAIGMYLYYNRKTALEVTPECVEQMLSGGSCVYDTSYGRIFTSMINSDEDVAVDIPPQK